MSSQHPVNVSNTLGILFSYLGGEVATKLLFQRFLWPQRFYNGFKWSKVLAVASMMPLGGPLHRAALEALDQFTDHRLMKGPNVGDFLGTAFFADTGATYVMNSSAEAKSVRNGFLLHILLRSTYRYQAERTSRRKRISLESKLVGTRNADKIRAIQTLVTLALRCVNTCPGDSVVMNQETRGINGKIVAGIITSETVSLVLAAVVIGVWKSPFAILWFLPLAFKLLAAYSTLRRHDLESPATDDAREVASFSRMTLFTIEHPGVYMIIRGPIGVVQQFFRHYGHPIRDRPRELFQIFLVGLMGMLCPIGLLCLMWMPSGVQYCWLGGQLFVILAFHLYRYNDGSICASTMETISDSLSEGKKVYIPAWDDQTWIEVEQHIQEVEGVAEARVEIAKIKQFYFSTTESATTSVRSV